MYESRLEAGFTSGQVRGGRKGIAGGKREMFECFRSPSRIEKSQTRGLGEKQQLLFCLQVEMLLSFSYLFIVAVLQARAL